MNVKLRRFWFRTATGLGIGVTAYTEQEATQLARSAAEEHDLNFDVLEIIRDVDIRTLDWGHVIPNMHPPSLRGVWFPKLRASL